MAVATAGWLAGKSHAMSVAELTLIRHKICLLPKTYCHRYGLSVSLFADPTLNFCPQQLDNAELQLPIHPDSLLLPFCGTVIRMMMLSRNWRVWLPPPPPRRRHRSSFYNCQFESGNRHFDEEGKNEKGRVGGGRCTVA